jgi:hypothetical protein
VKAYVKCNKNDAADAEAICEAVKRADYTIVNDYIVNKSVTSTWCKRLVDMRLRLCMRRLRCIQPLSRNCHGQTVQARIAELIG